MYYLWLMSGARFFREKYTTKHYKQFYEQPTKKIGIKILLNFGKKNYLH